MKEWVSFLRTGYTLGREKGEGLLNILHYHFQLHTQRNAAAQSDGSWGALNIN